MRRILVTAALAGGFAALSFSAASAMPVTPGLSSTGVGPEQARLVCNEFGRCWRTGPRYYGYGPRYRYYGPRYGYYGPRYYRHYYGGPGLSFHFGL